MRVRPSPDPKRFDSDREALPFPLGGVFASQRPAVDTPGVEDVASSADVAAQVERQMAAVQAHLDALAREIDGPIPFAAFQRPEDVEPDDHWPAA